MNSDVSEMHRGLPYEYFTGHDDPNFFLFKRRISEIVDIV